MRRINHAIFRTAIARLRDACLRPGTNAMFKRRQNGSAGKPSRAACPADVTRRTRYKGQSWRTGTEGGDCLQSGEGPRSSSRLRLDFFIFKYSVLREMPRRIAACRRFPLVSRIAFRMVSVSCAHSQPFFRPGPETASCSRWPRGNRTASALARRRRSRRARWRFPVRGRCRATGIGRAGPALRH